MNESKQPNRVSAKIQQLLDTLKRPKRRPLNEYFEDNQEELESKKKLFVYFILKKMIRNENCLSLN